MLNRAPLSTEALNTNAYGGVLGVLRFTTVLSGTVSIDGRVMHMVMRRLSGALRPLGAFDRFVVGRLRRIRGKLLSQYFITGSR